MRSPITPPWRNSVPTQTVLLVGATGMLGARIAEHLLEADDARLQLLVRRAALDDPQKRTGLDRLVRLGAELLPGEIGDATSLDDALRGVDVVVSALQGGRQVIVDGQLSVARAAAANGVRRILPSDFALDIFKATPGEHAAFDLRREADEKIARLGIEQVNILNGAFLDMIAMPGAVVELNDVAGTATFWGTGAERFEATTVDDTARYAARVALDPDVPAGKFAIAAQELCFDDIVVAAERASGRSYARRSRGTVDELRTWVDERRRNGDQDAVLMGAYLLYMLTGQTKLDDLQNNRYPDIEPQTLDDLVRGRPGEQTTP
jgi:NmrA-like family